MAGSKKSRRRAHRRKRRLALLRNHKLHSDKKISGSEDEDEDEDDDEEDEEEDEDEEESDEENPEEEMMTRCLVELTLNSLPKRPRSRPN